MADHEAVARIRDGKDFMHYGDCDGYQRRDGSRGTCDCDAAADLAWFLSEYDDQRQRLDSLLPRWVRCSPSGSSK